MSRDGGENLYLKAIHHPEREAQLRAFLEFIEDELDREWTRLNDLEHDDGSIPDANRDKWNYTKGKVDFLRLLQGMFAQAVMSQVGATDEVYGHGSATPSQDTDDDVVCHECGEAIDHIEEPEDASHPVCPKCGGNPLPPVGGNRLPTDDAPDDDDE